LSSANIGSTVDWGSIVYMQSAEIGEPVIELSIVLPALGKSISLEGLLKLLTIDISVPYEIILLSHNNEVDLEIVERISTKYPAVRWLDKHENASTLSALKQGVQAAAGSHILMVCADTAGPIIAVDQMLGLAQEGYEYVSGTRYAAGGRRLGGPLFAVALSRAANFLLYSVGGSAFTDCTTGLKLFRKEIFDKLSLRSDSQGWVVAFEMSLKAQVAHVKIGEVANIAIDRLYGGDSTGRLDREFLAYLKWFLWGLVNLRKASVKHSSVPIRRIRIVE
jgi:hypothetical protein